MLKTVGIHSGGFAPALPCLKEESTMDYDILLDLASELGYRLAMSGAETYRIEESIQRVLAAYGISSEVFAIPNCITISLCTPTGKSATRIRRIGFHGNDLDSVEKYNSLSRRICSQKPDPAVAAQWLNETEASRLNYNLGVQLLGHILGAAGFSIFFGGNWQDALCGGLCGLLIGLTGWFLEKFKTNNFFKTIASAFIMTLVACICGVTGLANNTDMVVIGALMLLVPGLIFTNAMRDIIFGDTNSGINRIVQVLLIAAAIALGTGVAWNFASSLWSLAVPPAPLNIGFILQCFSAIIGCAGFAIIFNIHGKGSILCVLGGAIAWATFCIASYLGCGELICYFLSSLIAAAYSEILARIRKYPAISYLVVSIFPLIPGAGIYYATNHLVQGNMTDFAAKATHTVAIAGVIAVGILSVSTIVRLWSELKKRKA